MSEKKQLATVVIAGLILGIVGLLLIKAVPPFFEGDLVVSSYDAVLFENGTLSEQHTYDVRVSGEYRMLYRSWEAPLVFNSSNQPSVQFISVEAPGGTYGYAKDDLKFRLDILPSATLILHGQHSF